MNKYKWTNREQYTQHGIQQLADHLTQQQTQQQQITQLKPVFQRVLAKSDFAMVHFDDQTKEMSIHHLPTNKIKSFASSESLGISREYSSINNFFVYKIAAERFFGGRGSKFILRFMRDYKGAEYGVQYGKTLWERLDNSFSTNKDQISLLYRIPNFAAKLSRESRGNYIDFLQKDKPNESIGTKQLANTLKQSNLLSLHLNFNYSFLNIQSKLGWDYGNKSLFLQSRLKLQTFLPLSKHHKLYMSIQGAEIDGQNILKNDLLFRNKKDWPGNRTYNFLTPRVQLIFAEYPYLSYLNIQPYLYGQVWANLFRMKENNKLCTKIEVDYGIGLTSNSNHRLDISLFKMSTDKVGKFPFGSVKFTF